MIFGRPGSGKSTFALALSQKTGLPLHHLDKHFFEANWIERNYQEFLSIQRTFVESDAWIVDGNSTKSLEMRYSKADLVLYFNYPRWICYWRIVQRLFKKNNAIDDRASGCKETIRLSLLRHMWSFEERVAKPIALLKEKYPSTRFIEMTSDREAEALLK
ncbi:MAG: DNA topology modulation protein [Verrucomicrobia bacterium]|nr:DNA topology modulation protein [Verrucomicrobiota bacterium]